MDLAIPEAVHSCKSFWMSGHSAVGSGKKAHCMNGWRPRSLAGNMEPVSGSRGAKSPPSTAIKRWPMRSAMGNCWMSLWKRLTPSLIQMPPTRRHDFSTSTLLRMVFPIHYIPQLLDVTTVFQSELLSLFNQTVVSILIQLTKTQKTPGIMARIANSVQTPFAL